jgi:hypothetical protein
MQRAQRHAGPAKRDEPPSSRRLAIAEPIDRSGVISTTEVPAFLREGKLVPLLTGFDCPPI